jgi:hypothetical protein
LALRPKAICALDSASQMPASASGTAKVRGDRASHTDTAADEVLMRDRRSSGAKRAGAHGNRDPARDLGQERA